MVLVTNLAQTDAKDKIWFTSEELDSFEANMSCYVKMVRLHISKRHAPMASNILGLEKFLTVQLTGEYKGRRSKLTKDVVGEDAWHRSPACASVPENEIVERLARISAENSKWARERARAAAMFLEQDQESECLAEERLREAQTAALHQAIEARRPTLPRQQSWQRNRRTSLQETKRSRIVDAPQSKSEGDMMSCQAPRFTRAVSPSESSC